MSYPVNTYLQSSITLHIRELSNNHYIVLDILISLHTIVIIIVYNEVLNLGYLFCSLFYTTFSCQPGMHFACFCFCSLSISLSLLFFRLYSESCTFNSCFSFCILHSMF